VDIRDHTIYDTMLAQHILDNRGPFTLTDCTLKYTSMGRYDRELVEWKKHNEGACANGYGAIPEEILVPYSIGDVQAPWLIFKAQMPLLEAMNALAPRGNHPSLLESVIRMSSHLYELHYSGLQVDPIELDRLTKLFNDKKRELAATLETMAIKIGWEGFNPNSDQQKQKLLFGPVSEKGLGLVPVKSTGKRSKSWEWVMAQRDEIREKYNPSADSDTLSLLADQHPFVAMLLSYNRVNTICKSFLREDKTGGINGNVGEDGRVHAYFSLLTGTGRLRSRKPNVQNFPKSAEAELHKLFPGQKIPSIRTVFIAEPGCVLIEADYKQAELFTVAWLSQDGQMMSALTTPGEDLHTKTAVESFELTVTDANGVAVDKNQTLALAAQDLDAFEELEKTFIYTTPAGLRMTHKEFKGSIRVSAKAINFGILYGRGAAAIATQIKSETGLDVTEEEIQKGIDGWKRTYARAWAFMMECADQAIDQGYVENAWGRRRYFDRPENNGQEAASRREGSNHPIQGTVADTMIIACDEIIKARNAGGYKFKLVNQVHDALIYNVPEEEVEDAKKIIIDGMYGVGIPIPNSDPLHIGVDLDVYNKWCED
jgi:DNA polymerase-1